MTELETIARAKQYLDKLANGMDPLTDLPVAENDVINQVRISRCLFFVSDVLRQVLENGGVGKTEKLPFAITAEQLARVPFSAEPLRITELCQRITDATGQSNMARLSPATVLDWLESLGMLAKMADADGKQKRRPTPAGNQLGITEAMRSGRMGDYLAVLYNRSAQQFIVDNLDAALAAKAGRPAK